MISYKELSPNRTRIYGPKLDSSRGLHSGRWREDVYDCRPGDRVWRVGECGVWVYLLDLESAINSFPGKRYSPGNISVFSVKQNWLESHLEYRIPGCPTVYQFPRTRTTDHACYHTREDYLDYFQ